MKNKLLPLFLILFFFKLSAQENEKEIDNSMHVDFRLNYLINKPVAELGKSMTISHGISFGMGIAPIKNQYFIISLDMCFMGYAPVNSVLGLPNTRFYVNYVNQGNFSVPANRVITHRLNEYSLGFLYGFKISEKIPLRICPSFKAGFTVTSTRYEINDVFSNNDDDNNFLYCNILIPSTAWFIAPGLNLRFTPFKKGSGFDESFFLEFQTSYLIGSEFKYLVYGTEYDPNKGFLALKTNPHPNAYVENVGNVFENNLNMLQFKLGLGFYFGKINKNNAE
jgi:hypothetical protein